MADKYTLTRFGNPVLREDIRRLSKKEILSNETAELIKGIRSLSEKESYSVGIAASQVGHGLALSVIAIKPTPTRPDLKKFESVIINPEVVETYGEKVPMWEGCMSCGSGDDTLYAQVPRYKKIKLRWLDEKANEREEVLEGFVAHVAQHETDHTNGILFVDRVEDTKTFIMSDEYKMRIAKI